MIAVIFKYMMATDKGFFDKLSPEKLCDWLAARLKAKGLELKEEQRHIFLGIKLSLTILMLNHSLLAYDYMQKRE